MPLTLSPQKDGLLVTYAGSHTTSGRAGTTLRFEVPLRKLPDGYAATLTLDPALGKTPEEALAKLADNLRRVVEGMERVAAEEPTALPVAWQAPMEPAGSRAKADS